MSASWQRIAAVVRLELAIQRREPLTALYPLVLGLLAMAFAAAGPVDLVRGRGAVPRDAAWSLMLASTALTAFGQVITTMVAATVVLRDRADRVDALLDVSRLTRRESLVAKLAAALCVLLVIYSAIPLGLVGGAVIAGGSASHALRGSLPPFVLVVIPTMLAVGALQFAVGVLSGRLWAIVGQGLVLIWLWSEAIARVGRQPAVAMLDPFGSAALLQATVGWTDAERLSRAMPVTALLVASRLVWLGVSLGLACVAVWAPAPVTRSKRRGAVHAQTQRSSASVVGPIVRAGAARSVLGALATARYVARWMLRDTGWQVLAALGALNVAIHAFLDAGAAPDVADGVSIALAAMLLHARLFLVLLATIYAGELVWREDEERSAPFFDMLPLGRTWVIAGRIGGAFAAQSVLVAATALAAALATMVASAHSMAGMSFATAVLREVMWPFVSWLILSLAVHVVVRQKVAAHLCCIGGWVLAVVWFGAATSAGDSSVPGWVMPVATLVGLCVIRLGWAPQRGRRVRSAGEIVRGVSRSA